MDQIKPFNSGWIFPLMLNHTFFRIDKKSKAVVTKRSYIEMKRAYLIEFKQITQAHFFQEGSDSSVVRAAQYIIY